MTGYDKYKQNHYCPFPVWQMDHLYNNLKTCSFIVIMCIVLMIYFLTAVAAESTSLGFCLT